MTGAKLQLAKQLPDADCGLQTRQDAGFMHPDCFSGPATAFRGLDGTAAQGKAAQGRTVRAVPQPQTGFRFHFAKSAGVGGRWKLIFIDLREPCIA